jgi:hypothetical protein
MPSISGHFCNIKPQGQYDYIDALRFRSQHLLSKEQIKFLAANSDSFAIKRGHRMRGFSNEVVTLVVPNEHALRLLADIGGVRINYLEVARDLIFPPQQLRLVKELFDQHFVQPWHGKRETVLFEATTYTGQRKVGNCHHFVWYADQPSKVTGELDCFHIEGRYQGVDAVRKAGVNHPRDLLTFDFGAYWNKHLTLYAVDFERLGRWHSNRQAGAKRRHSPVQQYGPLSYNRDHATGCLLYHIHACHPEQERHSVQMFVEMFGRGPFLRPLIIVIYHEGNKVVVRTPCHCSIFCKSDLPIPPDSRSTVTPTAVTP